MDHVHAPLVFAAAGIGQPSLLMLLQFAMILGIFYFLILLPMKKRQKKIESFQEQLKVGDKVITTGGIHGLVTRLGDKTIQVQIADRVRIEISRQAIAGYQGQEPVVADGN